MQAKIAVPSSATLKKYGLTEQDFWEILHSQGDVCPITGKLPNPSKRDGKIHFVIDHFHAKGFAKMAPEKRKTYVRGLVGWYVNRYFLSKGIDEEKALNIAAYLKRYEQRRSK